MVLRSKSAELQCRSNPDSPLSFVVVSFGSEVFKLLPNGDTGRVIAVFERCVYIQCKPGIICIAIRSLGEGPLHVLLSSDDVNFLNIITTGMLIDLNVDYASFTRNRTVDLFDGQVPRIVLKQQVTTSVEKNLRSITSTTDQGFGWIVNADEWQSSSGNFHPTSADGNTLDIALRKLCIPAIASLYRWLHDALKDYVDVHPPPSIEHVQCTVLLGAGPGLTPAGDDLLAGVLLALHYTNHGNVAAALWSMLKPQVNVRTHPISAAHLRLAAKGQCAEPVLQLLDCLFSVNGSGESSSSGNSGLNNEAQQIQKRQIHRLADNIGSSSGWDMLAGITLVVRAL